MGIGIDKKDVTQGLTCLSPWGMDGMKKHRESPGMSSSSSSPLSSPPFPNIQSNPSSLMSIFPIPVAGLRATEWARGHGFSNGRGQSPSRIGRSWTAFPRDSILKMTGIPLGPMNSRIAHWFLLATAETLFPQFTEACVPPLSGSHSDLGGNTFSRTWYRISYSSGAH